MTNAIAWMGGSRPLKPTEISSAERSLVSYLFREQVATFNLFWGDMPTRDTLKTLWNRARHDAHATYRSKP